MKKIFVIFSVLVLNVIILSNIYASSSEILSIEGKSINVYEKFDLKTLIKDKNSEYTYTSSNDLVASVSKDGIITGNKLGDAIITVRSQNGNTATLDLRVGYYKGIDISNKNNSVDFPSIKAKGIDFVMIRSSYGWYDDKDKAEGKEYNFQFDKMLENNIKGASDNNIPFGIYHYSYATNKEEATLEAEYTINALKSVEGYAQKMSLPIAYDVEDEYGQAKVDKETLTDVVITYCKKIKEAGYPVMIYANKTWFMEHLNISRLNTLGYDFWYALWPNNPDFSNKIQIGDSGIYPLIWQYTSEGSVPGANTSAGTVCLDIMYMKDQVKLSFVVDGQVIEEKGIDKGSNTTFPKFEKDGYALVKWVDENNKEVTEETVFNKNTTITAEYTIATDLKGDVNKDKVLNINDINYALRGLSKGTLTKFEKEIGDVNNDGNFNINDVNMMIRSLSGKS